MDRRHFVQIMILSPITFGAAGLVTGCGNQKDASLKDIGDEPACKSFGYYEGISPTGSRSSSRTDGTYSQMPCITFREIERGVEKTYQFWHGHGGGMHQFTVTADHFTLLRAGKPVEILTDVINGHRHALRINVEEACSQFCG